MNWRCAFVWLGRYLFDRVRPGFKGNGEPCWVCCSELFRRLHTKELSKVLQHLERDRGAIRSSIRVHLINRGCFGNLSAVITYIKKD